MKVTCLRTKRDDIKQYINDIIGSDKKNWIYRKGSNFGTKLQEEVGNYFKSKMEELCISDVEINTNPNDVNPDIVIHFIDNTKEGFEVKSCKDGALGSVTICNSPHLLNDKKAFLINYTVGENNVILVEDIYQTEIFRLTSINSRGKYKGCLRSTRDTGKKIKGRTFNDFISTCEKDDYTLKQLTDPKLIRKTVLYHSAAKLVDDEYIFTDKEILSAIQELRKNDKKKGK